MTEDLDIELSLYVRPHRAYGTLFVLELVDLDSNGDGNWCAQSESERGGKSPEDRMIDAERAHRQLSIPRESVALLRQRLRDLSVAALPLGWIGLGATKYELRARDGLTAVAFAWSGELPEEWAGLAAVVAFLESPNDANLVNSGPAGGPESPPNKAC